MAEPTNEAVGRAPAGLPPGVQLHTDSDVLTALAPAIDELHRSCGAPVTARRLWLHTWYESFSDYQPLIVSVTGAGGVLDGLGCLAHTRRYGFTSVVAAGHGASDYVQFSARSASARDALTGGMVAAVERLRAPWTLHIRQMFADDDHVESLRQQFPHGRTVPAALAFTVLIEGDRSKRSIVSTNHHRKVRRLTNRLERSGSDVIRDVLRDEADIARLLPDIRRIHLLRDDDASRVNRLVNSGFKRFFEQVLLTHAREGMLELTILRIDGVLAAYAFAFVEDGTRRLWNARFDPAFAEVSAGQLAIDAALDVALTDPDCQEFDLMVGDEPYKRSLGARPRATSDLHAWSSSTVKVVFGTRRRAKELLRPLGRHPAVGHVWLRYKAWRRRAASSRR